ncbi:MAG: Tim44-like domain-containing protein [Rhodocyclaceae bacterium]|nr:Tim44-like domain-containing protein [Rhodocyclaceae bacterium]MDZ4216448.1 Tim44-like domain-containing protein [Rhodocyclaceae bacterium]
MKTLALFALALTIGFAVPVGEAEAKRLGGSKSIGMQKQMSPPAKSPNAAPATTAPTAAAAPAAGAAAAAPAAAGRSWMGPIAGIAAGLGLAALASHLGFGEELASFMMMALLAFVVIAAVGFFMRKRAMAQQPAMAGAGNKMHGMQYSAERMEPAGRTYEAPQNVGGGGTAYSANAAANIPADFDVPGFVRNAKVHYIRLQAANDAGNLDDIREFTTPEMFAEIKMAISERGGATQETDVVAIEADVIEVVEEAGRYIVSVRFTGQVREDAGPATAVDEVWHLVKPLQGKGGWLLAGIQQLQ